MTRYLPENDPQLNPYLNPSYGYRPTPPSQPYQGPFEGGTLGGGGPMAGSGGVNAYRFIIPPGMVRKQNRQPLAGGFLSRMTPNGIYGDYLNRLTALGKVTPPQMAVPGQYAGGDS